MGIVLHVMYAKIFLKIFDSSIAEDWQCRVVFQDILILANRDGVVDMTHEAIARRTNVPLEIVKSSILKLESPDPKSNTPEDDGRRLERIAEHKDWGWRIINYGRYRDIKNSEEFRAATRERVAKWRAEKKKKEGRLAGIETPKNLDIQEAALQIYDAYPRKIARKDALNSILKALKKIFPEKLLELTKQYANARIGEPEQYTPHPATWFNGERFNDDPKTWKSNSTPGKPNPRNFGIATAGPSYGDAARAKLQRQGVVPKMAEAGNNGGAGVGASPV